MTDEKDGKEMIKEAGETAPEEELYPPFLDYLQSPQDHEIASRLVAFLEEIKKVTLDRKAEEYKLKTDVSYKSFRILISLQTGIFIISVISVWLITSVDICF